MRALAPRNTSEPSMSVQVDQISSYQKRLQFLVPGTEVSRRLDEAYRTLSHRVNIPGFRRGHVPRRLLEQRYGRQIRSEVASELINARFRDAVQGVEFIGQPEVEKDDLHENADFRFSITLQVRPDIEIADYTGIKVEFPLAKVADEQVEGLVQKRLAGHSRLVEVEEDRPVRAGDLVLTEITLIEDGQEKTVESGTMINTAGDRYYPGLETLLVGVKKGEEKQGSVSIADSSLLPGLKGKTVDMKVKVFGLQVSRIPEPTDEVAAEMGYEGGMDAMRAALRMEEEGRANEAARNLARVDLLRKLTQANKVDVPPAMVDGHLQMLMEELRIQAAYRGRDPRSIRYTEAQMADLRERAEFAARASLLLDAVARKEGIAVSDEDLEAKYQEIADARGQRVEAIRGYFKKDNAVEELRKRLLEERTLEWLLERSELVEREATEGVAESAAALAPPVETPAEVTAAPAAEEAPTAAAEPVAKPKKPRAKKAKPEEAAEGAE
ncbi:MAG: trigger factor [Elusimicrobia bacterium]|nr:trigger factor [Elusimicrobiota bacterium]